jgi:hypothetical protein
MPVSAFTPRSANRRWPSASSMRSGLSCSAAAMKSRCGLSLDGR